MAKKQFPISVVISAVDKATAPLKKINDRIEKTFQVKKFRQLGRSIQGLADASGLPKVAGAMGNVGSAIGGVVGEFGALATKAGLFIGSAVAGLVAVTRSAANTGDALRDFEKQTGFSADRLQELNYISSQTGGPEDMSEVIRTLTNNYGRLQAGTGKLASFLKKVSPPLYNQVKAAGSSEKAFDLLLGAMSKIKDPARRTALAIAAFGPEGAKLAEMADESADSLDAMKKRAHELGLVMGKDAREDANSFNDSFAEMVQVLNGVKNTIGVALMPILKEYLDKIVEFVRANRGQIVEFAQNFAAAVKEMIPLVIDFAKKFFSFFVTFDEKSKSFKANMGNIRLAMIALGAIILGPLLASIVSLGAALVSLGVAIGVTPIGWFIGIVAALVAVIALLVKYWEPITAFFSEWSNVLIAVGGAIAMFVMGPIGALIAVAALVWKNWQPISDFFSGLWDKIKNVAAYAGKFLGFGSAGSAAPQAQTPAPLAASAQNMVANTMSPQRSESEVRVKFDNLPAGARVMSETKGPLDFGLEMNRGPLLMPN